MGRVEAVAINLSMAGRIRTKEKCPRCGSKFVGEPLACPSCLTAPKRVYLRLYVKGLGNVFLYSDRQGRPLSSFDLAQRVLTGIRYEIDQGIFDPSKYIKADIRHYLFENRIEDWHQSKDKEAQKGNLANSYTRILRCYIDNYYLGFFKGKDVREIKTLHIKAFYERLPRKSLKYLKNIMTALENFFNTLQELEIIDKRPIFPSITVDQRPPKWIGWEEQTKIIKLIPLKHRPIFLFLAWQGVRPGEARALKVKDMDLKRGTMLVARTLSDCELKERVKSKIVKMRAVNPALMGLLKRQCADKHPEAFVFTNPRTGGPYSESAFKRIWDNVKAQGFSITPYQATRHSFATHLVTKDVHLNVIKGILGHTDIRTTLKYAHDDVETQKIAFERKVSAKIVRLGAQWGPNRNQSKN